MRRISAINSASSIVHPLPLCDSIRARLYRCESDELCEPDDSCDADDPADEDEPCDEETFCERPLAAGAGWVTTFALRSGRYSGPFWPQPAARMQPPAARMARMARMPQPAARAARIEALIASAPCRRRVARWAARPAPLAPSAAPPRAGTPPGTGSPRPRRAR